MKVTTKPTPVGEVVAIHPHWNLSGRCGVVVSDKRTVAAFEKAWEEQPVAVQAEFGFDLPLWGWGEAGSPPRRCIVLTFAEYVDLVKGSAS